MNMQIQKKCIGFTLIESLLYIGIASVLIVLLGGIGVNVLESKIRAQALEEVHYNAEFIIDHITRSINQAEHINTPLPQTSGSLLSLEMLDSEKNPTVIDIDGGRVRLQEGADEPMYLSGKRVYISTLQFLNVTQEGGEGSVRITFTAEEGSQSDTQKPLARTTFYTTVGINNTP